MTTQTNTSTVGTGAPEGLPVINPAPVLNPAPDAKGVNPDGQSASEQLTPAEIQAQQAQEEAERQKNDGARRDKVASTAEAQAQQTPKKALEELSKDELITRLEGDIKDVRTAMSELKTGKSALVPGIQDVATAAREKFLKQNPNIKENDPRVQNAEYIAMADEVSKVIAVKLNAIKDPEEKRKFLENLDDPAIKLYNLKGEVTKLQKLIQESNKDEFKRLNELVKNNKDLMDSATALQKDPTNATAQELFGLGFQKLLKNIPDGWKVAGDKGMLWAMIATAGILPGPLTFVLLFILLFKMAGQKVTTPTAPTASDSGGNAPTTGSAEPPATAADAQAKTTPGEPQEQDTSTGEFVPQTPPPPANESAEEKMQRLQGAKPVPIAQSTSTPGEVLVDRLSKVMNVAADTKSIPANSPLSTSPTVPSTGGGRPAAS